MPGCSMVSDTLNPKVSIVRGCVVSPFCHDASPSDSPRPCRCCRCRFELDPVPGTKRRWDNRFDWIGRELQRIADREMEGAAEREGVVVAGDLGFTGVADECDGRRHAVERGVP